LKKENYDMSDAATAVIGFVNMNKAVGKDWFLKFFYLYL
jgi:hypothetical protein